MTRLRKLDPIVIPKIITSIHIMQLGKVICFAFSDGTVQYRDRITMNEIYNEPNLDRIMTLGHVGFQFAEESPCKLLSNPNDTYQ
jgi:mediator of RNA polymerase II transcription subunit 16